MPCICQYFVKDRNNLNNQDPAKETNVGNKKSESVVKSVSSTEVSASELAYLKAEVWSLKANLSESLNSNQNMQKIVRGLVEEKYGLIEELNESKRVNDDLWTQCLQEREMQANEKKELINEIFSLKNTLDENISLLNSVTAQNVELKMALQEANENIYKMGIKYLKLKGSRKSLYRDNIE